MNYLIDANNLAGVLGILFEDDFDKLLIDKIRLFNQGKGRKVYLVFDGIEIMGDRFTLPENIEVIYTPRDGHYRDADDMILELLELDVCGGEVIAVSDDIDLGRKILKLKEKKGNRIFLEKARDFACKLNKNNNDCGEEDLKEDKKREIDNELFDLWVKK